MTAIKTKPKANNVTKLKGLPASMPEAITNDETKIFEDLPVGTVIHQGDVILVVIKELPASAKPRQNRQVADGNTQGSRHIYEDGALFDCPATEVAELIKSASGISIGAAYCGPIMQTPGALTHPEHGDHVYKCSATIAVAYQRNLDAENREARVRD
jgi:hypothetical protein